MDLLHFLLLILLGTNASFNNVEGLKVEKIVGGILVRRGELKYTVAVMYKSIVVRDQNPCAGSILSDWFIATVAHCFYDKIFGEWRTSLFYISVGVHNLDKPLPTTRHIHVDRIIIPTVYNTSKPDNYATEGNFAMVKLVQKLGLRQYHPTILSLIPRQQIFRNLGAIFFVTGYGYQEVNVVQQEVYGQMQFVQNGSTDRKLRYAKAKVLSHKNCQNIINDIIAPGNMCAQLIRNQPDEPTGICKYDSGAPLVNKHHLSGIAINGFIECDEKKKPGVYINVMQYYPFIKTILEGKLHNNMKVLELKKDDNGEYAFKEI